MDNSVALKTIMKRPAAHAALSVLWFVLRLDAFTEASIGGGDTSSSTAAVRSKIRELQQQPQNQASAQGRSNGPQFLAAVPNITVAVGRDAQMPCVVRNLQDYKVAFIHLDRQMILTIHNHVITRIPRFEMAHDKHHTWNLMVRNVQKEDKGHYMCQINTDPMLSNVGYLNVVVPPNIVDAESSPSSVSVRENHNASLICKAEGTPQPKIKWTREDKKPIIIKRKKKEGKKERREVHGEVLDLIRISRTEMGAYLCIAQNGVPPSISKRIILTVEFSPLIWIPQQLVGAPLGTTVKLQCHIESSPKAISYWSFNEMMVLNSDRFLAEERHHSQYKLDSTLTLRDLRKEDFGTYRCIAKNSLGETDGTIRLYELEAATEEEEEPSVRLTETAQEEAEGYVVADVDDFDRVAGDGYRGEDPTEEEERERAAGANNDRQRQSDLREQSGRNGGGEIGSRNNNNGRRRKNRKKGRSSSRPENSQWNNGSSSPLCLPFPKLIMAFVVVRLILECALRRRMA